VSTGAGMSYKEILATFHLDSAIRGYHIYKEVWPNPFLGEIVRCECEERNAHDPFAVTLKKAGTGTVGHVPRTISCICTLFLRQGGAIEATVTGPQRYSPDLRERWCRDTLQVQIYWKRGFNKESP